MAVALNDSASQVTEPAFVDLRSPRAQAQRKPGAAHRLRFHPLCVAAVLEMGYQVHVASAFQYTQRDRDDWYYYGLAGPRILEIAGLAR